MEFESEKIEEDASARRSRSGHLKVQFLFRICAAAAALSAALFMRLNRQSTVIAGFAIEASYKSSPAFELLVYGNGIAAAYLVASLPFLSCRLAKKGFFIMHLLDLANMSLVMGVASAAAAIGYVGKNGNDHIGWTEVCPFFEAYCRRAEIAVGCSSLAFFTLLLVCALSFLSRSKLSSESSLINKI